MRDLAVLFIHLITTIARLAGPGGAFRGRRIRSRQTATPDPESFPTPFTQSARLRSRRRRLVCSPHASRPPDPFCNRIETSTLLSLHRALKNRKYRLLFSLKRCFRSLLLLTHLHLLASKTTYVRFSCN